MKSALVLVTLIFGGMAAGLGAADLSTYRQGKEHDEHPAWVLIEANKAWLVFFLTLGSTAPVVITAVVEVRKSRNQRKDLIIRCLQLIHMRAFPHFEAAGMSYNHRVSLFTPKTVARYKFWPLSRKRVLQCEHRTGETQPRRTWDLEHLPEQPAKDGDPGASQELQGLVVKAWVYQLNITVAPQIRRIKMIKIDTFASLGCRKRCKMSEAGRMLRCMRFHF